MDPAIRRIEWHEETIGRTWSCRVRERSGPGCSIIAAIACAPILLFLAWAGPRSAGGGLIPTFGVLEMALPIALLGLLALRDDRALLKPRRIALDPDRFCYETATDEARIVATADIGDFDADAYAVRALDREGKPLFYLHSTVPAFLCKRLRAALDRARQPLTYRA